MIHLISVAYIVGQTFNVFHYGGKLDLREGKASFVLEVTFICTLAISGILNMWSILKLY